LVRYKNLDRYFYRFVTIHACERQTDGQTDRILIARPRLHSMQRGNNASTAGKRNIEKVILKRNISFLSSHSLNLQYPSLSRITFASH